MDDLSALRQSTNDTARVARTNLLFFLAVGLFLGLLVAGTNDLLLLKRANITLPLMDIGVPIDVFYVVGPFVFILLHLNVFLCLVRLYDVADKLRQVTIKTDVPDKKLQTYLLFPFDFLQLISQFAVIYIKRKEVSPGAAPSHEETPRPEKTPRPEAVPRPAMECPNVKCNEAKFPVVEIPNTKRPVRENSSFQYLLQYMKYVIRVTFQYLQYANQLLLQHLQYMMQRIFQYLKYAMQYLFQYLKNAIQFLFRYQKYFLTRIYRYQKYFLTRIYRYQKYFLTRMCRYLKYVLTYVFRRLKYETNNLYEDVIYARAQYGYFFVLSFVVAIPIFFIPVLLLLFVQLTFLPYQSEAITFVHQVAILLDVVMQMWFLGRLRVFSKLLNFRKKSIQTFSRLEPLFRNGFFFIMLVVLCTPIILFAFSWSVALVPDSLLGKNPLFQKKRSEFTQWVFNDWWYGENCKNPESHAHRWLRRYLYLPPGTLTTKSELPPEIVATYLAQHENPNHAWEFIDPLNLSNRSLRYGWFESSVFWRTNFTKSDLHCANFQNSKIHRAVSGSEYADKEKTKFIGANFFRAEFHGGEILNSIFQNVRGEEMKFFGTDLSGTEFHGSDARTSTFQGVSGADMKFVDTNFSSAKFHGTDMPKSRFVGTDLSNAEFHGAFLKGAEFDGALLDNAEFYGVVADSVEFTGVYARQADFYGTNLNNAKLTGANIYSTNVYASDLRLEELELVDAQGFKCVKPDKWENIENKIRKSLSKRDLSEEENEKFLDVIEANKSQQSGSRGLGTLWDDLKKNRCVWTGGHSPFEQWNAPTKMCLDDLDTYLVNKACTSENPNMAEIMVTAVTDDTKPVIYPDVSLSAHVAMGLLETDPKNCSVITQEHRTNMCDYLKKWIEKDGKNNPNSAEMKSQIYGLCFPQAEQPTG